MKCNKTISPKGQPVKRCGKNSGQYIYCEACEKEATIYIEPKEIHK